MTPTAAREGLLLCECCYQLNRRTEGVDHPACARCGMGLHPRYPGSIARTWAFLLAAVILYVPANVLPVIESSTPFDNRTDTILSGVIHLWTTGSMFLAAIVFTASIVIPAAKLGSLALLLVQAQRRSTWRPDQRAKLYRATHYIGRWSMVDIYVGAVLVAMVQLKAFASIVPGPGALYFAGVVILTMMASMSFDPRLTWDAVDAP